MSQSGGSELARDLEAAVHARRELGPDYDEALTHSFVDRVDQEIARRVEVAVQSERRDADHGRYPVGLAYASLGVGIPITGAAAGISGVPGLAVAWAGIAAVNIAAAIGTRRGRGH